jgi:hypothetical protein
MNFSCCLLGCKQIPPPESGAEDKNDSKRGYTANVSDKSSHDHGVAGPVSATPGPDHRIACFCDNRQSGDTPHRLIFYIDSGPFRHSSNQFDIGCSLFTFNSLSGGVTNRLMMR